MFCNSAIKAAESDHEMVVQTLVQTRQELKDLVTILFSQSLGLSLDWILVRQKFGKFEGLSVSVDFETS